MDKLKNRRQLLKPLSAIVALGLGIGVGFWQSKTKHSSQNLSKKDHQEKIPPEFWQIPWNTLSGENLQLNHYSSHYLLINFWASWCAPCVRELPLLNTFAQMQKNNNWRVIALAIDEIPNVEHFLKLHPLPNLVVGISIDAGMRWQAHFGNTKNTLPFSMIINPQGIIVSRFHGEMSQENLDEILTYK